MRERLTHYLILLVLVIVMNFFLPRWMPGSPVKTIMGEDVGSMTAAEKMGILEAYNLDKPLGEQFLLYLRDLFTLNWGDSYAKRQPILDLIASRIGWTLLLAGGNLVLSTVLGTQLPGPGTIYMGQELRFTRPVFFGDTITATVTVVELIPEKNRAILDTVCTNQNGEVVIKGKATVMPPKD